MNLLNPLAQTFTADLKGGIFATSIAIYFYDKDDIEPVGIQIRTVVNGTPTAQIVPFSEVILPASAVLTSDDSSLPTNFTFTAPVYLQQGVEYAFVVMSNSAKYSLWVSELGGTDVYTPSFNITKQPNSGVMFKSSNGTTWTPDQTKDIKFLLRRATFAQSGSVVFSEAYIPPVTLENNPVYTYAIAPTPTNYIGNGTTTGTITIPSTAGMTVGDKVTISGASGTQQTKFNGTWYVASIPSSTTFTVTLSSTVSSGTLTTGLGTVSVQSKVIWVYHQNHGHFPGSSLVTIAGVSGAINSIPASEINTTHTVSSVEQDWYSFTVSTTYATASGRGGGGAVTATENRPYDVFQPLVSEIVLPDTISTWTARLTTGKSLAGSETPHTVEDYVSVKVNDNNFLKRPHTVVSTPNRASLSFGDRSFTLKSDFTTDRNNISPVVDLGRLSVATIANRIDNPSATSATGHNTVNEYVPETAARYTSSLSKYITKRIDLNDPASAISVYLSVNRPTGSYLTLYFKILPQFSDANFEDIGWTIGAPDSDIPISDDPKNYSEVSYSLSEIDLGNVQFSAFAIKLVFNSENSSAVPTCKDFRAIAVT